MRNSIEEVALTPLENPKFIKGMRMHYSQNGVAKDWEVVKAHDSVAILLYHKEEEAFVLVRQFRPAVYLNNKEGMTLELCAGIVDKPLSLKEIAKEEIEEECGYEVPLDAIERVSAFHTSVGFAGSKQTLYYAEIDHTMRRGEGGGVEGESIEVVMLPLARAKTLIYDEEVVKTSGLMFAFMWFFEHRGGERVEATSSLS
jgi:UDP-sugar diphosphatase